MINIYIIASPVSHLLNNNPPHPIDLPPTLLPHAQRTGVARIEPRANASPVKRVAALENSVVVSVAETYGAAGGLDGRVVSFEEVDFVIQVNDDWRI